MGSGIPYRQSNMDERESKRNGDEEDDEEEIDETVGCTEIASRILSQLAGLQDGQRCSIIRH